MSKEKQIEEMAKCCTYYHNGECCADATNICDCDLMCVMFGVFANLENAGYLKQSEGEWTFSENKKTMKCTRCRLRMKTYDVRRYCPNCGARMRKEDEGK
jgi:hypothetical protein